MQNEMQNDKKSENIKRLNCHMEFWLCSLFLYPVLDIPNSTVSIFRKTLLMNLRHDVPSITSGYGLVAMMFASHAKGREFDPHYPYVHMLRVPARSRVNLHLCPQARKYRKVRS